MEKNDEVTVLIEDMTSEGLGIGHADGMAVFIKDTVPGDTVRARVVKIKKTYAFARLTEIVRSSADRVQPACPVARRCGGCQLQMMSYESQLKMKQRKVAGNLMHIGGFLQNELPIEPVVPSPDILRYRNKAQFPIGEGRDGRPVAGFYAGRTHSIIPCTDCRLGVTENASILSCILKWMEDYSIRPYDERTGRGYIRNVLIRKGFETGQIQVCLVANAEKCPREKELVKRLTHLIFEEAIDDVKTVKAEETEAEGKAEAAGKAEKAGESFSKLASIVLNINTQNTNVILGDKTRTLWGSDNIRDVIRADGCGENGVCFEISPKSFYQVNPHQTRNLYSLVLEYAQLTGTETVWDLYCGIGTISLCMARRLKELNHEREGIENAGNVYGVEIVPEAIENARHNAQLNNLYNAKFFVGKAEEVLPEKYEKDGIHADVMIVDPPRKGCDEEVLQTMVKMQPKRIVYVSCDSATLARDLRYLREAGYMPEKIRPVDMFAQTVHVETCVLLCREKIEGRKMVSVTYEPTDEEIVPHLSPSATYAELKQWIEEKYHIKVSSLYIAQVKGKHGLDKRENFNKSSKPNARVPQCPPDKEKAIEAALRHFKMIT